MNQHLRKLQCFFAFTCYLMSSLIIFNPLYRSTEPLVSLFVFFITGTFFISFIPFLYQKIKVKHLSHFLYTFFCILCCGLSVFLNLILLTRIIKDTAYIANRNISMFYYVLFTLFVLFVSFYLCSNGFKGIYRFSIICIIFFALLLIMSLTVFFSTKGIAKNSLLFSTETGITPAVLAGFKAGIFSSFDSLIFIMCFKEYLTDSDGRLYKHALFSSFFTCFAFFAALYLILTLTFSKEVLQQLSYPVYSLLKLVYAFDAVDVLSFVLIPAYMIKSSVYMYSSSVCLNRAISKNKDNTKKIIAFLHLSIPVILTITAIFFKSLSYGAFQHTVYITNALFCIFFIFLITEKKKQ